MQQILIIDDDRDICLLLNRFLTRHGFKVTEAYNSKKATEALESSVPDLVLCDFRLDDTDGSEMLVKIKEKYPHVPVIIMTGYSDIKTAVEVMKLGAYDYVTKPLFPDEILLTIKKALISDARPTHYTNGTSTAIAEKPVVKTQDKKSDANLSEGYVSGDSEVFRNILRQIELVAPTNFSIIIYGESGSGKEVIANEIHRRSKRKDKPFVAIDCGALSKELAGSELFGHEKGSFTGAVNQKTGSFELANGGTIFLDEIANLSYDIQVSLLRMVQERKCRRVGGTKDIELDVRIIVASNEKLWEAARKGKFREDLYHRFNEFSFEVPPLRERKEDILLFAGHFLKITNHELEKQVKGFTPEVEAIFKNYVWFGNLRELRNVVKRSVLLSDGDYVDVKTLPFEISNYSKLQFDVSPAEPQMHITSTFVRHDERMADNVVRGNGEINLKSASIDAEYETIVQALKQVNFNKSKAARLLNIDRKTLYNKMKQYKEFNNLQ
ncbi:MAG: sigma-54 dependent transcriptional regulator [Chitinophagaceae bacterium]